MCRQEGNSFNDGIENIQQYSITPRAFVCYLLRSFYLPSQIDKTGECIFSFLKEQFFHYFISSGVMKHILS
jgi:hypothetical protein